jgi:RNA polymerase primary sigma factor
MPITPRTDDALSTYLAGLRRRPLLTRDEELRLARLAADGDRPARAALVEANLRLVVSIARRYQGRGLDLLDLIQEGNLGLIDAAERYDWRRGVRFATYATWAVRREILRALCTSARLVRLPLRTAECAGRVRFAEAGLEQRLGRRASVDEVARAAGVAPAVVVQLRRAALPPLPLGEPGADGEPALEETLGDGGAADPSTLLAADGDADAVHSAMAALSGRERRLVELRYGIGGRAARTLAAVADELGVSRERVRHLEARALRRLGARAELQAPRAAA